MSALLEIDELRRKLREKFPAAHRSAPLLEESETQTPLTFQSGELHEIVALHPGQGIALLISELLANERDLPLALVDGRDSFDPGSHGNLKCQRLFWIRCREVSQAIQCTDLLLRDGSLPLIILDLHLTSTREFKRLPRSSWHRLRAQARETSTTLVTLTPQSLIPSIKHRLTLSGRFTLNHLELEKPQLLLNEKQQQDLAVM